MKNFRIFFLLLFTITLYAKPLIIDEKINFYDLLPHAQIYIDKSKVLDIDDIKNDNIIFKNNDKKLLGYGYSPNFNVWIKFTLKNNTNKTINKIIEYDNSLTTSITFYDISNKNTYQNGSFYIDKNRKTINPIFKIKLEPNKTNTYYIKANSYITSLIIKLNMWEDEPFYEKEIKHQFYLALFFGAMIILAL